MALVELLADNVQTVLIVLLALLIAYYIFGGGASALPPSLQGWPLIGNMLQVKKDMAEYAMDLSKKLSSDIVSLKIGSSTMVFFNSYNMIKEAFAGDEFMARPDIFFKTALTKGNGVLVSDGQMWKNQRRFALTVLRDFGMGKMMMDENIREELVYVVDDIRRQNGKAYDVERIVNVAVANVMCQTALGRRYDYDDAAFIDLQNRFEENVTITGVSSPIHHFKFLQNLPIEPWAAKILRRNYAHVREFLMKVVEEHKKTFDGSDIKDVIDAYLSEIEKNKDKPDTTFTDDQLNWMIYDMFIAGSETTATSLRWALLYMIHYPDVQAKVQAELDEVIGRERAPCARDRTSLPYTDAVINEILRITSFLPLALPHSNMEKDVHFRGYTIPKGAYVFGNLLAVHRDPKLWKSPDKFDPDNFIDENGKLCNQQHMGAFSVGRRACLGEGLARMEMFLFFTRLLQVFSFKNPDGVPLPPFTRTSGLVVKPKVHYKVCAIERE